MLKKVLVPLTGRPLDGRAVAAAFLTARRFGARVAGFGVTPHAEVRASSESGAIPAALVEQLIRIAQDEQATVIDGARRLFEAYAVRLGGPDVAATWEQATGPLAETIAEEARLADIVVVAQASDGSNAMGPTIEAALFQSGRALLLAPRGEPASVGEAVAVAWDGGAAAARAVAAAMPFLQRAGKAVILSAASGVGPGAAPPDRLAEYLALHGVAAEIAVIETASARVSRALIETALGRGCDLMAMGAYGHSRMRERVWGGVTLDILREPPPLTVLMAH